VLEITPAFVTCLTPAKQIIKYCLHFLFINYLQCAACWTTATWLAYCQFYRYVYGTLHHLTF